MLLSGQSLLARSVASAAACPGVGHIVVVAPPSHLAEAAGALAASRVPVRVVAGGVERGDSVAAGLAALEPDVEIVLVHDAARAQAPPSLFEAVIEAVRAGHPAVVPGLPVVDTIKQVDDREHVVATPVRAGLRAIQTPQGFRRDVLVRAHGAANLGNGPATDDAALVERLGVPVLVVPGHRLARKITTAEDLAVAEALGAADVQHAAGAR